MEIYGMHMLVRLAKGGKIYLGGRIKVMKMFLGIVNYLVDKKMRDAREK